MSGYNNPFGDLGILIVIIVLILALAGAFGATCFVSWLFSIAFYSIKFWVLLVLFAIVSIKFVLRE